jgi:predicted dehydrogenase
VSACAAEVEAPALDYRPPHPTREHGIALVGAGGISFAHLDAYRAHGFPVRAILSRDPAKAAARAGEFFPDADVMTEYEALLSREDISVVDLTPHPKERLPLIERALKAGKHVLSQKPFVTETVDGERLCDLADATGVVLAVNQNGRWAPHFAWMRAAVREGLIGEVMSVHCGVHWDHRWIKDTPFEAMPAWFLASLKVAANCEMSVV